MSDKEGWIKVFRKIQDNDLWTCEPFTRGQAWIDLLLLANHKYSFFYKRNIKIEVQRGQLARSEVELSDRWKWSRTKVRRFLNDLEKEQQIKQQKTNVTQIVTIINYDEYQKKEQQDIQQENSKKTAKEQQENTYKNVKNDNNEKNNKSANNSLTIEERISKFKLDEEKAANELGIYDANMLNNFYLYWTEKNPKGRKMRFEKEKIFDIKRRLATWRDRQKNFGTNQIKQTLPDHNKKEIDWSDQKIDL